MISRNFTFNLTKSIEAENGSGKQAATFHVQTNSSEQGPRSGTGVHPFATGEGFYRHAHKAISISHK